MKEKQLEEFIEVYGRLTQSITESMESIQKHIFKNSIVTPEQFNALYLIHIRNMHTSSILAKETGVKKSTITAIVNRLDDKGLVNRTTDKNDRRIILLQVTEKGQEVVTEGTKMLFDHLSPLGDGLTAENFESLNANLTAIANKMKSIKDGVEQNEQ